MKRAIAVLAAGLLVTTMIPAAGAQSLPPTPSADDLGVSGNDVRDEPSAPKDDNGFEDTDPFFSPKDDPLVLDGYVEHGTFAVQEDISNIRRLAVHGNNDDGERHMYPGPNSFEVWWGWWSDTGTGGDLQNDSTTDSTPLTSNEGNGAIDESNDCRNDEWDEFTWRGDNPCAKDDGHEKHPGDSLFAFVQPGTHNIHINSIPAPTLGPIIPPSPIHNDTDHSEVPDFRYDCRMNEDFQGCFAPNGFSRFGYDQSLVMTTQVVSAVNPLETGTHEGQTTYDPYTIGTNADTHAVDQDFYSALAPEVEDAYRMTVWNPEQDYGDDDEEQNLIAPVHEGGLKQFVKEDGNHQLVETSDTAQSTASSVVNVVEPQAGLAYDAFFGPRPHEPNTAGDDYNGWATFDADTSYGGLDGDYYEPGADQTYTGYQAEEHTWLDTTTAIDVCPILNLCYHEWAHLGPSVPSSDAPVEDAANRGDSRSVGPGILYVHSNLGTWYDANGDTWVGDASKGSVKAPGKHGPGLLSTEEGEPYSNGLIQDPNQYDSDEFRPVCSADFSVTLESNLDSDGDGVGEWGTTGVYVVPTRGPGLAYSHVYMDLLGDSAEPAGNALRNNDDVGGLATLVAPDDQNGELSRYRVEGPIEIDMRAAGATCPGTGSWDPNQRVVFPTGNPGYSFTVTTEATGLEDQDSLHGANEGADLEGESITDVDVLHANQDEVAGQPVLADHPLGNNPGGG